MGAVQEEVAALVVVAVEVVINTKKYVLVVEVWLVVERISRSLKSQ